MHQQQTAFGKIVGKEEIARNKQFLLYPQCFLLNQKILSSFVNIFAIISLFAAELEEPKIGMWGNELSVCNQGPKNFRILTCPPAILHLSYKDGCSTCPALIFTRYDERTSRFFGRITRDQTKPRTIYLSIKYLTFYQTTNFRLLNWKRLQTTISDLKKMAESSPDG